MNGRGIPSPLIYIPLVPLVGRLGSESEGSADFYASRLRFASQPRLHQD